MLKVTLVHLTYCRKDEFRRQLFVSTKRQPQEVAGVRTGVKYKKSSDVKGATNVKGNTCNDNMMRHNIVETNIMTHEYECAK